MIGRPARNPGDRVTIGRPDHKLGDRVTIGDGIPATIEEIIYCRHMAAPFYLVEYWHEGHLISRRVHAEDCR